MSACLAAPASAATLMPCSWHFSITSTGGEPSALAISTGRCLSATSRCDRATECSQPRTPSRPSPSGSGGTPSLRSVSSTNFLCSSGIIAPRSTDVPSVGIFIGITMSTPYGLPSVLSSSQVSVSLELVGVVEADAAEDAEPAGARDRGGDVLGRGEREDRVLDPERVAQRRTHQTPRRSLAAKASAISLALGYCALPVALRGTSSTSVSARGSL